MEIAEMKIAPRKVERGKPRRQTETGNRKPRNGKSVPGVTREDMFKRCRKGTDRVAMKFATRKVECGKPRRQTETGNRNLGMESQYQVWRTKKR
jgi:hypothetical protein